MAGHGIKFEKSKSNPKLKLVFGYTNLAKYSIFMIPPGKDTAELLVTKTTTTGVSPAHSLRKSAAELDGAVIVVVAVITAAVISPKPSESFASMKAHFLQGSSEADGSPRTTKRPLKNGLTAFEVHYDISAS